MGRANRLTVEGGIFHVTHRCHNQAFLLKFSRDRNAYREKLREGLAEFGGLSLLDYTITSNHVHLLVEAQSKPELSECMRKVAGEFARNYNCRKDRTNAFWGDTFHAILVEEGKYLRECLLYIELNMVRCRAVAHPREWEWVGYHEIMGQRRRYCLLDSERLCWRLGRASVEEVRRQIEMGLAERIARGEVKRIGYWTEALGVGSRGFLEQHRGLILGRMETEIVEVPDQGVNVLREEAIPYGQERGSKNAAKTVPEG